MPRDVIKAKCAPYLQRGQPAPRTPLVNNDDHSIISTCGAEYRGLVNYYLLARDVRRLNLLCWIMTTSRLKTLACTHDSSASKMAAKYQATTPTPHGPRRCFRAGVERPSRNR
ncbi:group II intron reverse transcriptase/maturase [Amycolatopsis sp. NPDC059090]|uniref:group II intron reverse transcriptase/maturase n=1 Tax=Amycolatopsis sp. NPDC059090 TaxID=3346723 RepID=UPI00366F0423